LRFSKTEAQKAFLIRPRIICSRLLPFQR